MAYTIHTGNVLDILPTLPANSVQCCVTSPPYWGLRDYGVDGQLGSEATPEEFVANMVAVFREVRRVLRDDGTLFLNLGDSYAGSGGAGGDYNEGGLKQGQPRYSGTARAWENGGGRDVGERTAAVPGLKPKDLVGIPWRVALALQADGYWLRSDIIWHKPNPMPESVTDRPTKAHEYIFLLTKSARYYYDAEAIKEPAAYEVDAPQNNFQRNGGKMLDVPHANGKQSSHRADRTPTGIMSGGTKHTNGNGNTNQTYSGNEYMAAPMRNRRSVWTMATRPFKEAHFATFPPELPELCILAGTKGGDLVLDPFTGSGTTGAVAVNLGRDFVGCELNPAYVELAHRRIGNAQPALFGI